VDFLSVTRDTISNLKSGCLLGLLGLIVCLGPGRACCHARDPIRVAMRCQQFWGHGVGVTPPLVCEAASAAAATQLLASRSSPHML
jgi:hypothetical protein